LYAFVNLKPSNY